jgi:hypothetical protein
VPGWRTILRGAKAKSEDWSARPPTSQETPPGATFGVFFPFHLFKLSLVLLKHRHLHVAVQLNEMGKQDQRAVNTVSPCHLFSL